MSFKNFAAAAAVLSASMTAAPPAHAGSEPFIGEIIAYPYSQCPRGYATAAGQLLSIAQNTALFSILGTNYGGNGQTTFALPDLRSRVALGSGSAAFGNYSLGQTAGQESFTVSAAAMPAHSHTGAVTAVAAPGNTNNPVGNSLATAPAGVLMYSDQAPANNMKAGNVQIGQTGGNVPVSLISPVLTMNYCIALVGIFPPRP